eukprot:3394550-Lingulodinium_polyedra.AAC.1
MDARVSQSGRSMRRRPHGRDARSANGERHGAAPNARLNAFLSSVRVKVAQKGVRKRISLSRCRACRDER